MASQFVGLTIVVTLNAPPNVLVQGLVANVIEETSTLILQNGDQLISS
jgi:enhancer of mRNA-decapping protein 3